MDKDGNLYQKRMITDCKISTLRAEAGSKGGKTTKSLAADFATAKTQATTEDEYESEKENINNDYQLIY